MFNNSRNLLGIQISFGICLSHFQDLDYYNRLTNHIVNIHVSFLSLKDDKVCQTLEHIHISVIHPLGWLKGISDNAIIKKQKCD